MFLASQLKLNYLKKASWYTLFLCVMQKVKIAQRDAVIPAAAFTAGGGEMMLRCPFPRSTRQRFWGLEE